MQTILDVALYWLSLGIATIPLHYKTKRPAIDSWRRYQHELPSRQLLEHWFRHGFHNIALICGWHGFTVIDFDSVESHALWLTIADPAVAATMQVLTNRGAHVYVSIDEPVQSMHLAFGDVKGNGGYVLTAPSIHPSGRAYQVVDSTAPIVRASRLVDVLPVSCLDAPLDTEKPVIQSPMTLDPWVLASSNSVDLTELRRRLHIEGFFPDRHATSVDGRWWVARCPFHDDKSPSLWIDTVKQIVGCYAGCTPLPLDVVNLYSRLHGVTNHDAIVMLSQENQ